MRSGKGNVRRSAEGVDGAPMMRAGVAFVRNPTAITKRACVPNIGPSSVTVGERQPTPAVSVDSLFVEHRFAITRTAGARTMNEIDFTLSDFWIKVVVSSIGSMFGALFFRLLWTAIRDARKWRQEEKHTEYTFKRPEHPDSPKIPKNPLEEEVLIWDPRFKPGDMIPVKDPARPIEVQAEIDRLEAQARVRSSEENRRMLARIFNSCYQQEVMDEPRGD
jgi:hypothetical protein